MLISHVKMTCGCDYIQFCLCCHVQIFVFPWWFMLKTKCIQVSVEKCKSFGVAMFKLQTKFHEKLQLSTACTQQQEQVNTLGYTAVAARCHEVPTLNLFMYHWGEKGALIQLTEDFNFFFLRDQRTLTKWTMMAITRKLVAEWNISNWGISSSVWFKWTLFDGI